MMNLPGYISLGALLTQWLDINWEQ